MTAPRYLIVSEDHVLREADTHEDAHKALEELSGWATGLELYRHHAREERPPRDKAAGPEHIAVGKRRSFYVTETIAALLRAHGADIGMTTLLTRVVYRYLRFCGAALSGYDAESLEDEMGCLDNEYALDLGVRALALEELRERVEVIQREEDVSHREALRRAVEGFQIPSEDPRR